MTEIRNEVEKKTEEQFFNLIWKKKTYTAVNIDEDYNVSVSGPIRSSGKRNSFSR